MKKLSIIVTIIGISIAGSVAASYSFMQDDLPVREVMVETGSITTYVSATGYVVNHEELVLNSPVSGRIVALDAKEGNTVKKGQALVQMDASDSGIALEKARSMLRTAQKNVEDAERNHNQLLQLYQIGGESKNAVDQAAHQLHNLRQAKVQAQQDLKALQEQHARYMVKAPSDALVTATLGRANTWIKAGDPLLRIAPNGRNEIEVKLNAADSAAAAIGKELIVTSDAYPDQKWSEKIIWVAPATNKETASNSLSIRASLNKDAPPLVLGQQVDIKLPTAMRANIIRIPSEAITTKQAQRFVAVADGGKIKFIPIETGIEDAKHSEVTKGLAAGQRILIGAGEPLREGAGFKITKI